MYHQSCSLCSHLQRALLGRGLKETKGSRWDPAGIFNLATRNQHWSAWYVLVKLFILSCFPSPHTSGREGELRHRGNGNGSHARGGELSAGETGVTLMQLWHRGCYIYNQILVNVCGFFLKCDFAAVAHQQRVKSQWVMISWAVEQDGKEMIEKIVACLFSLMLFSPGSRLAQCKHLIAVPT